MDEIIEKKKKKKGKKAIEEFGTLHKTKKRKKQDSACAMTSVRRSCEGMFNSTSFIFFYLSALVFRLHEPNNTETAGDVQRNFSKM